MTFAKRISLVVAVVASSTGAPIAQAQSYTAPAGIPAAAAPGSTTLRSSVLSAPHSFTANRPSAPSGKFPARR